ncbi:MAG: hypothetical protein Q7S65_04220 [Nanoarchaeota archaeon]|nr:hypothetical protein [Nanoarchaeota archaeon]
MSTFARDLSAAQDDMKTIVRREKIAYDEAFTWGYSLIQERVKRRTLSAETALAELKTALGRLSDDYMNASRGIGSTQVIWKELGRTLGVIVGICELGIAPAGGEAFTTYTWQFGKQVQQIRGRLNALGFTNLSKLHQRLLKIAETGDGERRTLIALIARTLLG